MSAPLPLPYPQHYLVGAPGKPNPVETAETNQSVALEGWIVPGKNSQTSVLKGGGEEITVVELRAAVGIRGGAVKGKHLTGSGEMCVRVVEEVQTVGGIEEGMTDGGIRGNLSCGNTGAGVGLHVAK